MPRKPKAPTKTTPISSVRHKDKRTNIPTQELRDFVRDEEAAPKTILYPRDPSLDPQLVWRGKDEQDRQDLAVQAVPIYIQEKIQPQVIIEDLRARAKVERPGETLELFSDFNGIAFEDLVDFYHHERNWTNRMILGDSLLVMASLAEKEGLKGKVQTIYFDPPYGVEFGVNWQVSTRSRTVKDGRASDVTRQPEQIRAFRDTWRLGIHSYLAYLRDRFVASHGLLTSTGSLFVQIGDENVHLVRSVLDEVFGSANSHPPIVFRKKMMPMMKAPGFESMCDYILWYQKDKASGQSKLRPLFYQKSAEGDQAWNWVQLPDGSRRQMTSAEIASHALLPRGSEVFQPISLLPREYRKNQDFPFTFEGVTYPPPKHSCWSTTLEGMTRLAAARRLHPSGEDGLRYVYFHSDYPVGRLTSLWADTAPPADMHYVVETNTKVVARALLASSDPGDLILDPTCGGGTTAYVAEQLGRRWITIDTSRVALALARTRLMSARYPYYILSDSPEGKLAQAGINNALSNTLRTEGDIRKGFLYKRAAHVTLESIANNPDIRSEMTRDELAAAISRHAGFESLFDLPIADSKRIRVSGPFTVESLSPHRMIAADTLEPASTREGQGDGTAGQFVTMVLDNLRRTGVQNTVKGERLRLEQLEPIAGRWLQAVASYTEKSGVPKRVAVAIGPEHGTVDRDLIKEAAKEAMQGAGVDVLLVCGFAFGPEASETAGEYPVQAAHKGSREPMVADASRQLGRLQVLLTRMNPDLQNDELLKKTGAANLFMVFGEPDISVVREKEGRITVEIHGLDVYDPTTGEIRSRSTDQIACWFIDTDYNGESFFVRQAYFTGTDEPYEKLKRALRAEIDEAAWRAIYSTKSQPFNAPVGGRIAIKVINHYGDEVLKVLAI